MKVWRHLVFCATLSCLLFCDKGWALCADFQGTCQQRGWDVNSQLINHPNETFRHCQITVTIINCIEEYLCTCDNVTVDLKTEQTFALSVNEYKAHCRNVSTLDLRNETRLYCRVGQELPTDDTKDPAVDLEVENAIDKGNIAEQEARLLRDCPAYTHCFDVYHNALRLLTFMTNTQQQISSLCLANRYNIVCMSDALCECGEGDNSVMREAMTGFHIAHEQHCQEQISEPIMVCSGTKLSVARLPAVLLVLCSLVWYRVQRIL